MEIKDPVTDTKAAEETERVLNSLTDVVFGGPGSLSGPGTQVSQTDTLFANCRNYLVSNYRQLLSQLYVENGLVQTIIDIPVDDGLRGGFEIKTKLLDAEEIEDLHSEIEQMDAVQTLGMGLKWTRLFGGGGVMVITGQDPKTPLDIDAISEDEPLSFRAVDMWELFEDSYTEDDEKNAQFVKRLPERDFYRFYGQVVHKSRVLRMNGRTPPSFIRPRLRGWGFSMVESLVRSINQYLKSNNIAFEVLDEFKLDIFRIKGFNTSLVTNKGRDNILKRVALANQQKNYQNAMTMDIEDEYTQKQLTFAGLADIMKEIRMQVAADMRMPMTKLFGISASGFASGEEDLETYNGMVESEVRFRAKHPAREMVKIIARKKFGVDLEDLTLHFKPMRVLTAEQEEAVKTQKQNRVIAAFDKGLCSGKEAGESLNRDNLIPVQVEISEDLETMSGRNEDNGIETESESGGEDGEE